MLSFHEVPANEPADGIVSPPSTAAVIVIGSSNDSLAALARDEESWCLQLLGLSGAAVKPFLLDAVARLSPSRDAHSSFEFLVPSTDRAATQQQQQKLRRVVLAALPTYCSRNNTPAHPHSVSAIVTKHRGSGPLAIFLLSTPEHAFSQALAVARAFPRYSATQAARKTAAEVAQGKAEADRVFVYMQKSAPVSTDINLINHLADDIQLCQKLVDMPPCTMHCRYVV